MESDGFFKGEEKNPQLRASVLAVRKMWGEYNISCVFAISSQKGPPEVFQVNFNAINKELLVG